MKVTLVVRPFGAEGPAYVAGLGGRSVLASIGGQQLRAERDLEARTRPSGSALVEACPTLRDRGARAATKWSWTDLEALPRAADASCRPRGQVGAGVAAGPKSCRSARSRRRS